jgi:hypothetical protein
MLAYAYKRDVFSRDPLGKILKCKRGRGIKFDERNVILTLQQLTLFFKERPGEGILLRRIP